MNIDVEALKVKVKRIKEEIEAADIERGHCVLPLPSPRLISDIWAMEAHKKYWGEVKAFLTEYATLILEAKEVVAVGESDKITEWLNVYRVASGSHDSSFNTRCKFIRKYLETAVTGKISIDYAILAEMIERLVGNYPYSIYEPVRGDYDGNYVDYYEKKQGELQQWEIQRKQSMKS